MQTPLKLSALALSGLLLLAACEQWTKPLAR